MMKPQPTPPWEKPFIGKEMRLAKAILGLSDGEGKEHRQSCPICEAVDMLYFRKAQKTVYPYRYVGTFHCEHCGFHDGVIRYTESNPS